jgi:NADH-quinone oxidoreductase subunit N
MGAQLFEMLPMSLVVLGAFGILILSRSPAWDLRRLQRLAMGILGLAFLLELPQFGSGSAGYLLPALFGHRFVTDDFAVLFDLMFLLGGFITLLVNTEYLAKRHYYNGEFFALYLFSLFGMMVLAHSNDLVSAFIGLELASLSIYALVGYHKNNRISSEAMLKYLLLGSVAGVFFLLGIALVYGAAGTTNLSELAGFVHTHGAEHHFVLAVAGMLMLVTVLFKIGAVPFHSWVLDVYHGAPFPVTMFMASIFKIALFALGIRLFLFYFVGEGLQGNTLMGTLTVLTLLGGSWLALKQSLLKRMLAASSIVHSGYMMIALSSIGLGSDQAAPAIMFYLLSYFVSAVGAFGILSYLAVDQGKQLTYDDFKGFAHKRPYMAAMMAIFMLSLAGFPSTIGFLGKFYIFTSAIESKQFLLAGLGIFIAFVSVYYYFKLIARMYFYDCESDCWRHRFRFDWSTAPIVLMAIMAIWGGIGTGLIPFFPGADGLIEMARTAVQAIGG